MNKLYVIYVTENYMPSIDRYYRNEILRMYFNGRICL